MKILLFGKNGQVGWELQRSLAPLGELIALHRHSSHLCGDISDLDGIAHTVRTVVPDVIVNAAAYTAVDKAEAEQALAHTINALAPTVLAQEAKQCAALLVHYSTDYVFNGEGQRAWVETDATAPQNVYGQTKLDGEVAIQASGCNHLIFRTSWVYAQRGNNFAKTMLKLAQEREILSVIDDQIGAPTGADLLADVTAHTIRATLQNPALCGLYHLVANGHTSWYGYARMIIDYARQAGIVIKVQADAIKPVPSSAYVTAAKRPFNSRLDTAKLKNTFDIYLPEWQAGVTRMLDELIEQKQ